MMQKNEIKLAVIGGDLRQLVMARELASDGFEVALFGIDTYEGDYGEITRCTDLASAIKFAAMVILPIPFSQDNVRLNCPLTKEYIRLTDIFDCMCKGQIAAGGRLNETIYAMAKESGVRLFDYFDREELLISNAIPTAEGAVAIAMSEVPYTIHSSHCMVLGFGRVGKILSMTLRALGAEVTVAARKHEDFAWIRAMDCTPVHIRDIGKATALHDIIFNTVPDLLLGKNVLKEMDPHTLIIDLASKPGGVDMDYARECGINVIWALSLPGKVAPVTAGRIIKESILNIMQSEGVLENLC